MKKENGWTRGQVLLLFLALAAIGVVAFGQGFPPIGQPGGGGGGSATNAIPLLNGSGTNTTLRNPTMYTPTIQGSVFTSELRATDAATAPMKVGGAMTNTGPGQVGPFLRYTNLFSLDAAEAWYGQTWDFYTPGSVYIDGFPLWINFNGTNLFWLDNNGAISLSDPKVEAPANIILNSPQLSTGSQLGILNFKTPDASGLNDGIASMEAYATDLTHQNTKGGLRFKVADQNIGGGVQEMRIDSTGVIADKAVTSTTSSTNKDAAVAGKLVWRDANGRESPVTVSGSGGSFSGGTLSLTGGSGNTNLTYSADGGALITSNLTVGSGPSYVLFVVPQGVIISNSVAANGSFAFINTNGAINTSSNISVGLGGARFGGLDTGLTNAAGLALAHVDVTNSFLANSNTLTVTRSGSRYYWVATANVAITNIAGLDSITPMKGTLVVSNSTAAAIACYVTATGMRSIGSVSSNGLQVASGKVAYISCDFPWLSVSNYCDVAQP